jgi:probable addiction module antidote protein
MLLTPRTCLQFLGDLNEQSHHFYLGPAARLITTDDVAAYLEAALEDGDPRLVAAALGDVAMAKGRTHIAGGGVGRESLYKSLFSSGTPELVTVLKVISVLVLQLYFSATGNAKMAVSPAP